MSLKASYNEYTRLRMIRLESTDLLTLLLMQFGKKQHAYTTMEGHCDTNMEADINPGSVHEQVMNQLETELELSEQQNADVRKINHELNVDVKSAWDERAKKPLVFNPVTQLMDYGANI